MNKKMKIVSLLCAAVMLAGCAHNNTNVGDETNVYLETSVLAMENMYAQNTESKSKTALKKTEDIETYIPKDYIGKYLVDLLSKQYFPNRSEINIMPDKNSARLAEALRNIRINNSRFALPLMIKDIPHGFSIKIDKDEKEEIFNNFTLYMGTLYMGDEKCAETLVILKDGAEEKYGIIISISLTSEMCKWSVGDIELSYDYDKIMQSFGDPSSYGSSDLLGAISYITKNNEYVSFFYGLNAVMCFSFNMNNIEKNARLVEYVPYDDFDGIPKIPELTGEPREIDWNRIFDEDCVVIGNEKLPAMARIGDLGDDFLLTEYLVGKPLFKNENYLKDEYTMMYKGRNIATVYALREKNEQPEDAVILLWVIDNDIKFPAAVIDMPLSQDFDEISKVYIPNGKKSSSKYQYMGIAEKDGENYMCTIVLGKSDVLFSITPASVNPEEYKDFIERMNAQ